MIETDKEEAIIASGVWKPQIKDWINSKEEAFRVCLGEPSEDIFYDLVVAKNRHTDLNGARLEVMKESKFNRQQSWYKAGKPLEDWGDGAFHLGNLVVMATWLCGKVGVGGITFLDFPAEKFADSKYKRRTFRSVMKRLIEEFGLGVRYTDASSQLFRELGAEQFNPATKQKTRLPETDMPKTSPIFLNKTLGTNVSGETRLRIESKGGEVLAEVGSKEFCVFEDPKETGRLERSGRAILTDPADSDALAKALQLFSNKYETYVFSEEVWEQIEKLKADFEINYELSTGTVAFLGFAIGEHFNYIETEGVLPAAKKEEAKLLKALAKNKNIKHD